jgi:hypothetical protein
VALFTKDDIVYLANVDKMEISYRQSTLKVLRNALQKLKIESSNEEKAMHVITNNKTKSKSYITYDIDSISINSGIYISKFIEPLYELFSITKDELNSKYTLIGG